VEKRRQDGNQRRARHVYGNKGERLDGPPATSFGFAGTVQTARQEFNIPNQPG